jgi:hypothetical protein
VRRHSIPSVVSLLLLALAACSGGDGDGHRFRVEEIEGVRTARTTGGPRFTDELFLYQPLLTLQQDPAVPGSVVSRPVAFTTDGNGYYVADGEVDRIAVFDASGRYVRSLGSQGEGPGQWMNLVLQDAREGTVSSIDYSRGRLIRYTAAGRLREELQVPIEWRSGTFAIFPLPDRRSVLLNFAVRPDGMQEAMGMVLTDRLRRHWSVTTERFGPEAGAFPRVRFEPELGIVLSTGLDGRLDFYPVDGSPIHRIAVEGLPSPAWSRVGHDDAGFWWLRIPESSPGAIDPAAAAGGPQPGRWRILSPEGEYLGITTTPPLDEVSDLQSYTIPVSVAAGCLMGAVTDPAGGRIELRVWRLVPAATGLVWP